MGGMKIPVAEPGWKLARGRFPRTYALGLDSVKRLQFQSTDASQKPIEMSMGRPAPEWHHAFCVSSTFVFWQTGDGPGWFQHRPEVKLRTVIMRNSLSSFGFQSRAAQLTDPCLIFGMLLVHRYVYPDHPELETAEFTASLAH